MGVCSVTAQKFWMVGSCTVILLLALVIALLWPTLSLRYLVYPKLKLTNGTLNYDNWKETPIPMYLEIYLFNWTNSADIHNRSVKPNFVERGPYVFHEKHIRTNISWSDDFTTVDFYQKRVWHFKPELSNGSLDDEITNINPLVASVGYASRNLDTITRLMINALFIDDLAPLFKTKKVRELLFDGYDDELLTVLKANHDPKFPNIPFHKMGWFVERNNSETYDGKFRMFTGTDEITKLGNIEMWNGNTSTGLFANSCSIVRGTSGELWPPIENHEKPKLSIFAPDICRPIDLKYDSDLTKLGINGYKWIADDSVFDNGIKYPEMKCYCSADEKLCPDLKAGVFNASSCKYSSPAFISFPHFYLADKTYLDDITGLKPNKTLHQFSIALEPQTGIPLSINAALQINILIKPWSGIFAFDEVPELFVPTLWFKQKADLTPELADQARLAIMVPLLGVWIGYGLLGLGLLVAISGLSCYVFRWRNGEDEEDGQDVPILDE